uniref:NAD dependent epimerase/dehydratase family protein n=1 Tax=Candidatus Kentrum sp. UNK TaxID=2126344 RepID=A0A451A8G2_9GAMM|nr:MAG: hypothetical protein BECKUNK1418G_GA0071005_102324 [Candidatus Kentron sp. UNK]VFK70413.1 MAG: hypothetical protein BECKUNK1418H_GA0071006_102824 [Candidatus Kentron sp. UNK]
MTERMIHGSLQIANQIILITSGRGFIGSAVTRYWFAHTFDKRQGLKIASPEEIAWRRKWIDDTRLEALARLIEKSEYGQYLLQLLLHRIY